MVVTDRCHQQQTVRPGGDGGGRNGFEMMEMQQQQGRKVPPIQTTAEEGRRGVEWQSGVVKHGTVQYYLVLGKGTQHRSLSFSVSPPPPCGSLRRWLGCLAAWALAYSTIVL